MPKIHTLLGFDPKEYTPGSTPHKWDDYFGVELELEDVTGLDDDIFHIPGWTIHQDASLRNGIEYITNGAIGGSRLSEAIDAFFQKELMWSASARTSTHIHINVLDVEPDVVRSMFMIMYMIEEGIYSAVEEGRKWGGYSVSLQEMSTTRARKILNPPSQQQFIQGVCPGRNAERYYGFNTNIRRHGTVEFRYFPGGPTKEELQSWIDLVMSVKVAAKRFTPSDLIDILSDPLRVQAFLLDNFREWGEKFLSAYPAEKYYRLFSEVAIMAADEDTRELMNRVICIHPHYLTFLANTSFKKRPKALEYLRHSASIGNMYAQSDWMNLLSESSSKDKEINSSGYEPVGEEVAAPSIRYPEPTDDFIQRWVERNNTGRTVRLSTPFHVSDAPTLTGETPDEDWTENMWTALPDEEDEL